jgi:hypothetical protein
VTRIGEINQYKILVVKNERKYKYRWQNNIKIDIKKIVWKVVDNHLAQDRN